MISTALFILAIELIAIGWVRWRYGSGREAIGPPSPRSGYGEVSPERAQ
jgi:hypothetical protein